MIAQKTKIFGIIFFACLFVLSSALAEGDQIDEKLGALFKKFHLSGDASKGRDLPSISQAQPQLGKKLFFSKTLSGGRDVACVSCHHPILGGADGLSLARGADAKNPHLVGPGRRLNDENLEGPKVPRNAPTTFNVGLFDAFLLWDGAVRALLPLPGKNGKNPLGISTLDSRLNTADKNAGENLPSALARFPVVFDVEMRGISHLELIEPSDKRQALTKKRNQIRAILAKRLEESQVWKAEFKKVFGDEKIHFDRVAESIGEYIRSQVFVNSPWKKYVAGDLSALSPEAKRGALLFYNSPKNGGALCVKCHMGDKLSDERFHVIATPQIGRGKADGPDGEEDFGRFRESAREIDKYAFRTPSLLNVEVTGPWGRTGAFNSLEGIVAHHFDIVNSLKNFDDSSLEESIRRFPKKGHLEKIEKILEKRKKKGLAVPVQRKLVGTELSDLVAFLKSLTDPCVKDPKCLAPWVLDGTEPDELNLVKAVDSEGQSLSKRPYRVVP